MWECPLLARLPILPEHGRSAHSLLNGFKSLSLNSFNNISAFHSKGHNAVSPTADRSVQLEHPYCGIPGSNEPLKQGTVYTDYIQHPHSMLWIHLHVQSSALRTMKGVHSLFMTAT